MHLIIDNLIQLQELLWVKNEEERLSPGTRHEQVEVMINVLARAIPVEIRHHCERLTKRKKNDIIIAPVSGGGCSTCGLKLSSSLTQAVRAGKTINMCPNCSRILYAPKSLPRHVEISRSRKSPVASGVSRFSSRDLMLPDLKSAGKYEVIHEMADNLAAQGFIDSPTQLAELAIQRESVVSTWVEPWLAFPHARGIEGGGLTFSMGLSRNGVDFDGPALTVANIVFLVVIPSAASGLYLELLSSLSRIFSTAEAKATIMAERSPEGLWETLVMLTGNTIK